MESEGHRLMQGADILCCIAIVIIIITTVLICFVSYKIYSIYKEPEPLADESPVPSSPEIYSGLEMLEYSNKVMECIQEIVKHIVILRFKEFTNKYNIENINSSITNKLIQDIAKEVNNSIDSRKIKFEQTVFTEKFYMTYMIDLISNLIESLIIKKLEEE